MLSRFIQAALLTFFLAPSLVSAAIESGLKVPAVYPSFAITDQSTLFYVEPTISVGSVKACVLYVDGKSAGSMSYNRTQGWYERKYTFRENGVYNLYAQCTDSDNNSVNGTLRSVRVGNEHDNTPPTVGAIRSGNVTQNLPKLISVTATDDDEIEHCALVIDNRIVREMEIEGSRASVEHTFRTPGQFSVAVRCTDRAGNETIGEAGTFVVFTDKSNLVSGDLFKMICPDTDDPNHPCKAIYYYGDDGKRHAFPNEKTYFTWYKDFENIVLVTPEVMQTIPLGRNVIYFPGKRLLKFASIPTVYAVGKGGVLHPIANDTLAAAIFGDDWITQIDILSEVFFSNYSIGDTIDSSRGFDARKEASGVRRFNDILKLDL